MKQQILHISPIQTAKVFALLYFVISIPLVGLMLLIALLAPGAKPHIGLLLAMPFLYLVVGFISTVIGAWAYNLVASRVGGIEYTSTPSV